MLTGSCPEWSKGQQVGDKEQNEKMEGLSVCFGKKKKKKIFIGGYK